MSISGGPMDPEGLVTEPLKENTVRIITVDDLINKINSNERPQLVCVSDPVYYDMGFIRNSLKIPLSELEARRSEIDKSRDVITYCKGYECSASKKAAEILSNLGYDVWAYEGGLNEWRDMGYPMELEQNAA